MAVVAVCAPYILRMGDFCVCIWPGNFPVGNFLRLHLAGKFPGGRFLRLHFTGKFSGIQIWPPENFSVLPVKKGVLPA